MGTASAWTPVADTSAWTPVSPADDGSGALKGFIQNSPIGAVQGAAEVIRHPIQAPSDRAHANAALLDKAKDSYHRGDYTGALFHTLNYFLPGGLELDEAGEDFSKGHVARGTAKTLGIASTMALGAKAPAIMDAATNPRVPAPAGPPSASGAFVRKLAVKAAARTLHLPESALSAALDLIGSESEATAPVAPKKFIPSPVADRPAPFRVELTPRETPGPIETIQSDLPSGRVPGGIQNQPGPVEVRSRTPLRVELSDPQALPDATPIPSELPSGRRPGGISNMQPMDATAPAVSGPSKSLLDGVAQGFRYKDYASAPADAKVIIDNLARATQESKPAARAAVQPEPASIAEPKTELEDLLERSLNGEKVAEQAKAELNEHLKMEALKKTESIIEGHQTRRALKLGRFLQDYGITPEHIELMTPEDWAQVGDIAEVEKPSATTIQKTKDLLKMGQGGVK